MRTPIAPFGANFFHSAVLRGGSYASALMHISNRFTRTVTGRPVGVVSMPVVGACQKTSSIGGRSSPAYRMSLRTAVMQLCRLKASSQSSITQGSVLALSWSSRKVFMYFCVSASCSSYASSAARYTLSVFAWLVMGAFYKYAVCVIG